MEDEEEEDEEAEDVEEEEDEKEGEELLTFHFSVRLSVLSRCDVYCSS